MVILSNSICCVFYAVPHSGNCRSSLQCFFSLLFRPARHQWDGMRRGLAGADGTVIKTAIFFIRYRFAVQIKKVAVRYFTVCSVRFDALCGLMLRAGSSGQPVRVPVASGVSFRGICSAGRLSVPGTDPQAWGAVRLPSICCQLLRRRGSGNARVCGAV